MKRIPPIRIVVARVLIFKEGFPKSHYNRMKVEFEDI